MIKSQLGEVHLTKPDYRLCEILSISKSDVDISVEAGLRADLTAIINALVQRYGTDKAMNMWTGAVEVYMETLDLRKGDTNK